MPSLSALLRDKLSLTSSSAQAAHDQPIKIYYLAPPHPSASTSTPALLPIPRPQPLPPTSLLFSLAYPPPPSSPATAFFLEALPDPIGFLFHSSALIRQYLSLPPSAFFPQEPKPEPWRHQLIELELKEAEGLAATSGGRITVSLRWVEDIRKEVEDGRRGIQQAVKEFKGVLLHELVHTIQHDARSTCPGWLIESIADYVRLQAKLDPPHWRRPGQGRRDRGWEEAYDSGARFLAWLVEEDDTDDPAGAAASDELMRDRTNFPPLATGIPPAAQPTRYPDANREELPSGGQAKGRRGKRRGPYPDLVKVLDARMKYERWSDAWWEEMCGAKLEVLWQEYLDWYA